MAFDYTCQGCGYTISLRQRLTQSKRKCPACGKPITLHSIAASERIEQEVASAAARSQAVKGGCGCLVLLAIIGIVLLIMRLGKNDKPAQDQKRPPTIASFARAVEVASSTSESRPTKPELSIIPPSVPATPQVPPPPTKPAAIDPAKRVVIRPIKGQLVFIADTINGYTFYAKATAEQRRLVRELGRMMEIEAETEGEFVSGDTEYTFVKLPGKDGKPKEWVVKTAHVAKE